jgi:hypothetical protein
MDDTAVLAWSNGGGTRAYLQKTATPAMACTGARYMALIFHDYSTLLRHPDTRTVILLTVFPL